MDIPKDGWPVQRGNRRLQSTTPDPVSGHEKDLVQLLHETGQGDQEAFAQLYRQTVRRVFGMAKSVLVDPQMSEDVTLDVYLQVWRSADRYSPSDGSPWAWLMMIAHRYAVGKVRSEQSPINREACYGPASQSIKRDEVVHIVTRRIEGNTVVK